LAILAAVGWHFYRDLQKPELTDLQLRPGLLILAGILYLCALFFSAWFWHRLLAVVGAQPTWMTSLRAYFLGHLGKYVPGKAWALLLRGSLARSPTVSLHLAILTAFYEVLTTMAAGALWAAIVFALAPPPFDGLRWHPMWTGLVLLAGLAMPLLPGVFNFLLRRLARRLAQDAGATTPSIGFATLAQGLALTACGWILLGLSCWTVLQAVLPAPPDWSVSLHVQLVGIVGLAYVAGFLALVMPGGVGVREYLLLHLLAFLGPEALIAAAVLLLRLVWTAAEVALAGVLYFVPARNASR